MATDLFIEGPPWAGVVVGDCRTKIPEVAAVIPRGFDLIFADPPFNWGREYGEGAELPYPDVSPVWSDRLTKAEYLQFTKEWIAACVAALSATGSMWVNIPDEWAAEVVTILKGHGLTMINWCIWHFRFGQNTTGRFIQSKVHALYFARTNKSLDRSRPGRTWNPQDILEQSDRAAIYDDPRTQEKQDGMPPGMRVPMDVWYGQYWGRVQGNNFERRPLHDNQLPEVYLDRVVKCCTNPGDLVLDPFLGSGTTGVVAHALGRRFVGIEYTRELAESAFQRIKDGPVKREPATAPAKRRKNAAKPNPSPEGAAAGQSEPA